METNQTQGQEKEAGSSITLEVIGLELATKNDLVAMHRSRPWGEAYQAYRNHLYALLNNARIANKIRLPKEPYQYAEIEILLQRPHSVDVDSKYSMCTPILDVLQPEKTMRRKKSWFVVPGLGIIANDTDGEGGLPGCIKSLKVYQVNGGAERLVVTVKEVFAGEN